MRTKMFYKAKRDIYTYMSKTIKINFYLTCTGLT